MTETVVDASAALAWILKSQRTSAAMSFINQIHDVGLIAPHIFFWETHNVLLRLLQRGRLLEIDYVEASSVLNDFDIAIEPPFSAEQAVPLALAERLSLFDSAYLALAINRNAPLASRDDGLLAAAARRRVKTWDLR